MSRRGVSVQLWRYALVGCVATVAHYGVLVALVEALYWPAWLGSGLGAVVGAQVAFLGNRGFTFDHQGPAQQAWWRFQLTALAGALLGMAIVALSVAASWHYLAGQMLATLVVMLATFAVNRHWSFAATAPPV